MYQALEQFETSPIFFIKFLNENDGFVVITSFNLTLILLLIICSFVGFWGLISNSFFLYNIGFMFEWIYRFILDIVVNQAGRRSEIYFPMIMSLFVFILVCNIGGLVPGSMCITSQIFVTFTLSSLVFFGMVVLSVYHQGKQFIWFFVPKNVPAFLLPFLTCIEIISYISRLFSLAIRLFANMVAGHALLHIISGGIISGFKIICTFNFLLSSIMCFPIAILFAIVGLESGIAFLQAYVFVVLVCIYLNDCYGSNH